MGAQAGHWLARDDVGLLGEGDRGEATGLIPGGKSADHVHTGLLEPQARPCAQVAAGRILERAEQVVQHGVRPGMVREVPLHAGEELLAAHIGHERSSTAAPFAYVMPSKFTSTSSRSAISATIGCVDRQLILTVRPQLLQGRERGPGIGELRRLGGGKPGVDMYSANDSSGRRSFHHRIVTRLPNHMWASSWRMVTARRSTIARVGRDRKT